MPGIYYLGYKIDDSNEVAECTENNNGIFYWTITVSSPYLPAPTLNSPAYGSTGQSLTPTFSWSSVPNATSYRIMVATIAADLPSDPTATNGGPSVVTNTTTTSTNFTPAIPLNMGTTYYWEVHGRSASLYGAWSGINSFTTISPSIRISPLTLTFSGSAPSVVTTPAAAVASATPTISSEELLASVPMEQKLTDISRIYQGFTNSGVTRVLVHVAEPTNGLGKIDIESAIAMKERRSKVHESQQKVLDRIGSADLTVRHRFDNISAFSADVTLKGLNALQADPSVVATEPVFDLQANLAQGIPLIHGMTYRSSFNGAGMSIAICDSGVDYTHPRLGSGGFPNSKVIGGYNFGDGNSDPMPNGVAHGTCCAGIAAGDLGTVGDYIGGVAYNAKLYALKITAGGSSSAADDAIVAAWDWCVTHKNDNPNYPIMVISTSFGSERYYSTCDSDVPSMAIAANNAVAAGITVLASSGNDGYCDSISKPACLSSVISVGAVYDATFGQNGQYDPCVNVNSCVVKYVDGSGGCVSGYYAVDNTAADQVTSYANSASFLTLLAPGNKCYTLDIVGAAGESTGDYYDSFGGTSAACPYVAGAVACLQSAAKARTGSFLTPQEVKNRLVTYGDNITDPKSAITKPRVNLERAIQSLPGEGQTFRIYNDGTGKLTVNSITTETSAPWITFGPAGPFDVVSGGYQDVTVSVDFSQAPVGQSSVRLLVASTDSSKNPYPSGVYVQANSQVQTQANQTITFAPLPNKTYGEPPFAVSATASSGLTVSFNILSGPATLSGNNVTLTSTGTVVVRASQAGNASYNPAPNVDQPFTVYAPPQANVTLSNANLVISWPTNVAGFVLQSTPSLNPASWSTVSPSPVIVNGRFTVTNNAASGNMFYRLQK
jgi:subtilisin family serine protease